MSKQNSLSNELSPDLCCVMLCCTCSLPLSGRTAELTQIVTRMRITKPNQNEIQRNRSRSKQEGGCSYPAYYLRVWNSPLKVLKECKDPAINVVDKSPKPVNKELTIVSTVQEMPSTSTVDKNMLESSVARRNQEFETPAAADLAMEPSSQPSPIIAKSKRQSVDVCVLTFISV